MRKVSSLDIIIESDLSQLQRALFHYYEKTNKQEVNGMLEKLLIDSEYAEEDENILKTLFIMNIIFQEKMASLDGKTLVQAFVENKQLQDKTRLSTLEFLEEWQAIRPTLSVVTAINDAETIIVEDFTTKQENEIKTTTTFPKVDVGGLLYGFVLPFGKYNQYFILPIDLQQRDAALFISMIEKGLAQSSYKDMADFLNCEFTNIIKLIFLDEDHLGIVSLDNSQYGMVEQLYKQNIDALGDYSRDPRDLKEIGTKIWNAFCDVESPSFQKPQGYAAGLHYFIDRNLAGLGLYTQKQLAEIYGTSVTTLSKANRNLEKALEAEIEHLNKKL